MRVKSLVLEAVIFGSCILVISVLFHSLGTVKLVRIIKKPYRQVGKWSGEYRKIARISYVAVFLLVLHIIQIVIWAAVYCYLIDIPVISSFSDAFYFSTITYTTVGYGDIVITGHGRLLSGLESINGILMFGWSTALLFAAVQKTWLSDEHTNC